MLDNSHFYYIVKKFCESLATFAKYINEPMENNTDIIKNKKYRTKQFDKYINIMEVFVDLILELVELLKEIIISLNKLLIKKEKAELIKFLASIKTFLTFVSEKDIFNKLNTIKSLLNEHHIENERIYEKVIKIKTILFDIFNITIGITSIFIPQVAVILPVIGITESKLTQAIKNRHNKFNDSTKIDMDKVIHHILDIELRSEIISSINNQNIKKCIEHTDMGEIVKIVEELQHDYIKMHQLTIYLRAEIIKYKKKKFTINSIIKGFLHIK